MSLCYLSRSLLDRIAPGQNSIEILGLSWVPRGDLKSVGKSSLVARVLCKRHNGLLSTLDETASTFVDAIALADSNLRSGDSTNSRHEVSGRALERWCLKMLLGMLASGQLRAHEGPVLMPLELCRALLIEPGTIWPRARGLYFPIPTELVYHSASFECRPMSNPRTGEVLALALAGC